jgi:hypothetical protein
MLAEFLHQRANSLAAAFVHVGADALKHAALNER